MWRISLFNFSSSPLPFQMLVKTKSIFHLEEEEVEEEWGDEENTQINEGFVAIDVRPGIIDALSSSTKIFEAAIRPVDFLKCCFLCGKELSLQKEVFMYRGDQGFCSAECRRYQILRDEKSEIHACRDLRFRLSDHHQHHKQHLGSKAIKYKGTAKVSVAS